MLSGTSLEASQAAATGKRALHDWLSEFRCAASAGNCSLLCGAMVLYCFG